MSPTLAESIGAASYAAMMPYQRELVAHCAASMTAFRAAALVDRAGTRAGDEFARLYDAIDAKADRGELLAERFHAAVRAVTVEQLGEARAADWCDLSLSEEASRLYRVFLDKLPARHPELIREPRHAA